MSSPQLGQTMPQRSKSSVDLSYSRMTHAWKLYSSIGTIRPLRTGATFAKPLDLWNANSLMQRLRRLLKPTNTLRTWWSGSKNKSSLYARISSTMDNLATLCLSCGIHSTTHTTLWQIVLVICLSLMNSQSIASLSLTTTCTATTSQQPHFPIVSAIQHASRSRSEVVG